MINGINRKSDSKRNHQSIYYNVNIVLPNKKLLEANSIALQFASNSRKGFYTYIVISVSQCGNYLDLR